MMRATNRLLLFLLAVTSIDSLPIDIENVRQSAITNKLSDLDFHVNLVEASVDLDNHHVEVKTEEEVNVTSIDINDNHIEFKTEEEVNVTSIDINDNHIEFKTKEEVNVTSKISNNTFSATRTMRNQLRPGMLVTSYSVELTPNVNSETFSGRLVAQVSITDISTREDPMIFHVRDLKVQSVRYALVGGTIYRDADFFVDEDDWFLEIDTGMEATLYTLIIEYTGSLAIVGQAFYAGHYGNTNYLAMNLHPTHARRVFPCMDEPTETSIISFTFNGLEYNNVMINSLPEDNNPNQFRALQGPPHLWSMAAHNLNNINLPTSGVFLYVRPGVSNQDFQGSGAINIYFSNLEEWTGKPYFEIVLNQAERLNILALPDVSRDWYGLSTVALWEPYIFMENTCSIKQRYTALQKIAEALARQWFGYVIFPENWRFQWIVSGLASYAAFDLMREHQRAFETDTTLLDVNTLFVTEVIQESLYRDGYMSAHTLELGEDIFDEDVIRDYLHGIHKYKAPALFWMLRLVLGDEDTDYIKLAGQALVSGRALQTVSTLNFVDAINAHWIHSSNQRIDEIDEFLEPWIENTGCPLIHIGLRQGGVLVTQERFGYSNPEHVQFNLPITYTESRNPDFTNIYPIVMMDATMTFSMVLDVEDGDYVLFNIQGQGYYRVNYDNDLWENIIDALDDPERRAQIHPLNRATLIDDALNLARAGRIDYEIAFEVVLTMRHETEYAPWKAFIRNMNFLKKRLEALVDDDDDLDPDIYLRMIRRTIGAFEDEIGFSPDLSDPAMMSLTRGIVMDHACRAGYQPCIAAAVDLFYDPDSNDRVVNPNIPSDIRPAVYCAMVREGGDDVINALYERLEIEVSMWERVVILESLTCSRDNGFVRTLLEETLAVNSPYTTEEKSKIFIAAAESSFENARIVLNFIITSVNDIRNMYGGDERLEELILALPENMADPDLSADFATWVNAQNNNLDDNQILADRAARMVSENRDWDNRNLDYVYEWIDDNDAPTLVVSLLLLSISCFITLFNH